MKPDIQPTRHPLPLQPELDHQLANMIPRSFLALAALPLLASAHFELSFPAPRGDDDENQATFPCGGYAQTQNRTPVSLTSLAVAVELGHTESLFQIVLALGNDVGDSFNTVLLPTIQEYGPGDFCLAAIPIPADLNITDGTNGTIQVITNSHDGSGLYNVSFHSHPPYIQIQSSPERLQTKPRPSL